MTYSLLLHAIKPKPTRKELEEISVNVPSVAKADCGAMVEDWFGIIVSGKELDDARAFQFALEAKGCPTELVADRDIPALHPDYRCQRITLENDVITLTDAMGKSYSRNKNYLVFLAAGAVEKQKMKTEYEFEREQQGDQTVTVRNVIRSYEEKPYFRFDLFFSNGPHRVSLEIEKNSVLFYGESPIRLKNTLDLTVLMVDLQVLLPPERMNRSLRELSMTHVYPSMHAYQEELRWAFYRLGARG